MDRIAIEPVATYRVQLTPDFTFAEVVGILDHLCELGISHLYLSPILEAMPGSTHGYDWCPPARISETLGGADGFRLLRAHARAVGIGIIIDIVPNHVGIAHPEHNPWWHDVLVHGTDSAYAEYFDLDTSHTGGVINLPCLGSAADLDGLVLDENDCLVLGDIVLPTAPGTRRPGDDAAAVHDRQHYRLVPHDSRRVGYRRFLSINGLAALRQEIPEVYDATHAWLRDLLAEDLIDGVRVDHVDGLMDPVGYLDRLRADLGDDRLLYIEKGVGIREELDPLLPVDGTTGYDRLRLIEARFTAPTGAIELEEIYQAVCGTTGDGDSMLAAAQSLRRALLVDQFPDRLQRILDLLSVAAPTVPAHALYQAAVTLISTCPVSRPDYPVVRDTMLAHIAAIAVENPSNTAGYDVLAAAFREHGSTPDVLARIGEAVVAAYAKGVEDTGFHRTARLISSQELGCSPLNPAINRTDFIAAAVRHAQRWPRAMVALSTHDTKRSEDVRARISVIAQTPQRWRLFVDALWRLHPPPHLVTGYLLLQNVVGIWPDDGRPDPALDSELARRLADYARKAMREGGLISTWTAVDVDAEAAVQRWLADLLVGDPATLIGEFVAGIAPAGRTEALSRKAFSLLLPGVGDIYQGTQWWDDSLTDPDNRRPVDHSRSLDHPKARIIKTALAVRRRHPRAFGVDGEYIDVSLRGPLSHHVSAFARGNGGTAAVILVAVRLALMFDTAEKREKAQIVLPDGDWCDAVTGNAFTGTVTAHQMLEDRAVAVLERTRIDS